MIPLTEFPINTFVELRKISTKEDVPFPYPMVLDDGYWLHGYLANPIKIGERVLVLRTCRNGTNQLGVFTTSKVLDIQDDVIQTQNSYWKINKIENK